MEKIETEEQFTQQQIEQAAGDEKEIFSYYDIGMVKSMDENKKTINTIRKDTDTTGKLLVTLPIPEEYRGHANYSAVHMHNGQPVTLADLDDNPDTITVRLDGFSRFAFAYDDMVNQAAEDAVVEIVDNQVLVTSDQAAVLYIASYDGTGQTLLDVAVHPVPSGAQQAFAIPDGFTNAKVFLWQAGGTMQPLSEVK